MGIPLEEAGEYTTSRIFGCFLLFGGVSVLNENVIQPAKMHPVLWSLMKYEREKSSSCRSLVQQYSCVILGA